MKGKQNLLNENELKTTHKTKCHKMTINRWLLLINYYGIFFLMKRNGEVFSPRKMVNWGRVAIDYDFWYWWISRDYSNKLLLPLNKKEESLAKKASIEVLRDPLFYGLTSTEKVEVQEQIKKREQQKKELDERWKKIMELSGPKLELTITLIQLSSLYLNNNEETCKKIEDYYSTINDIGNSKKISLKIKNFLNKLNESLEFEAECEHMAMI